MAFDSLDARDWQILALLKKEARMPFAEIGRRVKLTAPAVAERVKRLEAMEVIEGFQARINSAALGRPLRVFLRVQVPPKEYPRFQRALEELDRIEEAHHVTGGESHVLKAAVEDVKQLEKLIERLSTFGPTVTSVVLSTLRER